MISITNLRHELQNLKEAFFTAMFLMLERSATRRSSFWDRAFAIVLIFIDFGQTYRFTFRREFGWDDASIAIGHMFDPIGITINNLSKQSLQTLVALCLIALVSLIGDIGCMSQPPHDPSLSNADVIVQIFKSRLERIWAVKILRAYFLFFVMTVYLTVVELAIMPFDVSAV